MFGYEQHFVREWFPKNDQWITAQWNTYTVHSVYIRKVIGLKYTHKNNLKLLECFNKQPMKDVLIVQSNPIRAPLLILMM
jgi:hypothetical protein